MAYKAKVSQLEQKTKRGIPDILGMALLDYQSGNYSEDIITYSSLGQDAILPLPYFFRELPQMPRLEQIALEKCTGEILDIGCGAGSHALFLQKEGFRVFGLDSSAGAIATCAARGLKKTIHRDINELHGRKFDTLLLLMNGIGIVGRLRHLDGFLMHLGSLLEPGGQILVDSSDIIYMFDIDSDGRYLLPDSKNYYGEVEFRLEYKGIKGQGFHWLYLDEKTLEAAAKRTSLALEIVMYGEHYDYLARLTALK